MEVEDGVIDALDEQSGRFIVRFGSGIYALFELIRQPGQEKSSERLAVGDAVRAAPDSVGKIVMLNMSRKRPLLVSGLTGPSSEPACRLAMGE